MPSKTLAAVTGNYDLGDVSAGANGFKVIEINVGSLTGSFAVQGRLANGGGTFAAIGYTKCADRTTATAAITATATIEVPCAGLEIRLAYTHTSGTVGTGYLKWLDVMA
jgi:hypothetical protein